MKKSTIDISQKLKSQLLQYPKLVDGFEKRDFYFLPDFLQWLKDTENILSYYSISDISEIAGIRSKILSHKYSDSRRNNVKKAQLMAASAALYDAQNIVLRVLKPYEEKLEECRELTRQLLSIVNQSGAVRYKNRDEFQNFVNQIWTIFTTHAQLKPGAVKLKTYLSEIDILRLISEEVEPGEWGMSITE